jgi:hypothetical protein
MVLNFSRNGREKIKKARNPGKINVPLKFAFLNLLPMYFQSYQVRKLVNLLEVA